ncbi:MAG: N-acetyl-gamma-glutamyl-phosphate reductase [Flavobacteriaceae bacterium]|nr:N-acetyl-gamma-glutamyl-phosphate reductase [Flavobacteriaceae bacterium]
MNKIKIGIIGGAGYTGGELLRLLIHHPHVEITFVNSKSHTGKFVTDVHTDLIGDTDLVFSNYEMIEGIDVLFLCVGHGEALKSLSQLKYSSTLKIIDLSQDHRIQPSTFVYGLPELNREAIKTAQYIANPGCFATCIELALLPLAVLNGLNNAVHISATTGATGAGQALSAATHFTWRHNNLSIYKAFEHQHLAEIGQSLNQLQPNFNSELNFIPYRGSFSRGIFASIYTSCELSIEEIQYQYQQFYKEHPFVHISKNPIDLKQVVNTNKCLLHIEKHGDQLLITSCIDNLLKGASGQAVQNMNLMFGLEENAGLKLKSINY